MYDWYLWKASVSSKLVRIYTHISMDLPLASRMRVVPVSRIPAETGSTGLPPYVTDWSMPTYSLAGSWSVNGL